MRWMTEPARRLAMLFVAAGVLAVMGTFVVPQGRAMVAAERPWAIGLAAADFLAAAVIAALPWNRWHPRATIVAGAGGLGAMVPFAALGFSPPAIHASFIVLLFVWLGAYHPPMWAFVFAAPAAVVYAVPLHLAGHDQLEGPTVVVVVPLSVLVGRTVAITTQRLHRKHLESERRAQLLGVVARAARQINRLDPSRLPPGWSMPPSIWASTPPCWPGWSTTSWWWTRPPDCPWRRVSPIRPTRTWRDWSADNDSRSR